MKNYITQFVKNSLLTTFLIITAQQTYSQITIDTDKYNMNSTNLVVNFEAKGNSTTNSSLTLLRKNVINGFPNTSWSIVNQGNVLSFTNASPTGNFTDVGPWRMRYILPAGSSPTVTGNIGLEVSDNLYVGRGLQVNAIAANGSNTLRLNGSVGINRDNALAPLHVGGNGIFDGQLSVSGGNVLELGSGLTKEANAGKICYGCFTPNSLNIVGAGTLQSNRSIYFWAEGGAKFNGALSVKSGITSTDYTLISLASWSDFVFNKDYKLPSLKETESFIKQNGHLPNIPSEKEVKEKGYNLHEMNTKFLQTIEELTLHAIAQEKTIAAQTSEIEKMKQELESIKKMLLNKK
jgi:hypothetical protein